MSPLLRRRSTNGQPSVDFNVIVSMKPACIRYPALSVRTIYLFLRPQTRKHAFFNQKLRIPERCALRLPSPEVPPVRLLRKHFHLLLQILRRVLLQALVLLERVVAVFALGACPVHRGAIGGAEFVLVPRTLLASVEVLGAVRESAAELADDCWVCGVGDAGVNIEGDLFEMGL